MSKSTLKDVNKCEFLSQFLWDKVVGTWYNSMLVYNRETYCLGLVAYGVEADQFGYLIKGTVTVIS